MSDNRPTVFLDRDGTVTEEAGYINHEDRLELVPHAASAIGMLNKRGVQTVMVSNQSGVARGYFDEALLGRVFAKMEEMLAKEDAHIDKIYYCPHHPDVGPPVYRKECNCRKPKTGMIDSAMKDLPIDLGRSYMVGDRIKDVYFGKRIGAKTVLVLTGYGKGEYTYQREEWTEQPDYIANGLLHAAKWILDDLENNRE